MPLEHAQGDAHVRRHMLERALVGGDGGKHLDLAWREREAAGEIPKTCFGVDGGIIRGRRGAGCRAFCGLRKPVSCSLSRYVAAIGAGRGVAGSGCVLVDCPLTRRDIARGVRCASLLPGAPCGFAAPRAWM